MRKLIATILIVTMCSVAFAAVQITITVPDAYTVQVLATMNTLAGTHMTLTARSPNQDPPDRFNGQWRFRIAPKDPNETNVQFAQRFTVEILRASVRVVKSHDENERYRTEISKVSPPDVNVPDGVVE